MQLIKKIHTSDAPAAVGPYSQAVSCGNLLYVSGQIPLDPKTGILIGDTVDRQAEQAIRNIGAILHAAGTDFSRVVKTTCYLKELARDFGAFNKVYERYFVGNPARACVEVSALPKGALVEIEVIAALSGINE